MTTLRATTVFSGRGLTVAAVESLEVHANRMQRGRWLAASLEPIAVMVREPGKTSAFDMDGQPIDIDLLLDLPADLGLE